MGGGSYGFIYENITTDQSLQNSVLKRNLVDNTISFIVSLRELDVLIQLRGHPNIVELIGTTWGDPYNGNLTPIPSAEPLIDDRIHFILEKANVDAHHHHIASYVEIKWYFHDLLQALKYLHSQNYIHRDVKPDNLLIFTPSPGESGDGILPKGRKYAKLCDFGLSRPLIGGKVYTPKIYASWYRAPEIFLSQSYSTSADIWAAGMTLYYLFTHKALCQGLEEENVLNYICSILPEECFKDFTSTEIKMQGTNRSCLMGKMIPSNFSSEREWGMTMNILIDMMIDMFQFNPQKRKSANDLLIHFPNLGVYSSEVPMTKIKIEKIEKRKEGYDYLLLLLEESFKIERPDPQIFFMTASIFDRYIVYIEKKEIQIDLPFRLQIIVMLYLSIKYFDTFGSSTPSYEQFVTDEYKNRKEDCSNFEHFLVNVILENRIYDENLYSRFHPSGKDGIRELMIFMRDMDSFDGTLDELCSRFRKTE